MEEWQTSLQAAVDETNWPAAVDILLQQANDGSLPLGEDERARRLAFSTLITLHCDAGLFDAALKLANIDYHRVDLLKSIALAEIKAGRHTAVDRLLQVPLETGREWTEASSALAEVAVEMARTDMEGASALLRRAQEEGWKSSAQELAPHSLAPIALAHALLGQFEVAHAMLSGFSQAADETWYEIAREEIRQGKHEESARTIGLIQNPTRQRHARIELALRTRNTAEAHAIAQEAERVRSQETRLSQAYPELDTILAMLARESLKAGRTDEALLYLDDIQRPQLKAMEMAQVRVDAGDIEAAMTLTEGMDGSLARDFALLSNVVKIAKAGDIERAKSLIGGIVQIDTRDRARASIVLAHCRAQDFEAAFTVVGSIQSEKQMAPPLGFLATALYASGRSGAAFKLISQLPRSLLLAVDPLLRALLEAPDPEGLKLVLPRCGESLASAWRFCTTVATVHSHAALGLAAVAIKY